MIYLKAFGVYVVTFLTLSLLYDGFMNKLPPKRSMEIFTVLSTGSAVAYFVIARKKQKAGRDNPNAEAGMGEYLKEAIHHKNQIKYFFDNAREKGYPQALHHWDELNEVVRRARDSKTAKHEEPMILEIMKDATPMLDEMKAKARLKIF